MNRYIVRLRGWTLKNRKSAVARSKRGVSQRRVPEARSEFVLPVCIIFHQHYQLVRFSDAVKETYLGGDLRCQGPDRGLSTPLMEAEDEDGDDEPFEVSPTQRHLRAAPQSKLQSPPYLVVCGGRPSQDRERM